MPAVKPRVIAVETPHKIARAIDDNGQDVTDIVRDLDNRISIPLDAANTRASRAITTSRVDLGNEVPASGPLYLIAKGWLHPSDSSINVAISQGAHEHARPLSLEVPDGHGGWVVARPNLGFPAGRKKICLIDLTNVFRPGTPHQVRLRTNLGNLLGFHRVGSGAATSGLEDHPDSPLPQPICIIVAIPSFIRRTARLRRFPTTTILQEPRQIWRDLEGYYTRYGDVRELLAGIDDRYVIMNAGDEISLRFPALPAATCWVGARLRHRRRWLDQGRRL